MSSWKRVRVFSILAAPWSSSMAMLNSEPVGDEPGPPGLDWLQDYQCWCGGMDSGTELKEVLALIKILLFSSQMTFEEFRADSLSLPRSSVLMGKPRPRQQPYQETAFPSCIRRHHKQRIAKPMRGLFTDTSGDAKPCFQKLSSSPNRWLTEILPFCHLFFYWLMYQNHTILVPYQ